MTDFNSINQNAKKELRRRQEQAENTAKAHREELSAASADFKENEEKYRALSADLIKAVIARADDQKIEKLRNELKACLKNESEIAESLGYGKKYIYPEYFCKECNDQGLKENGEECDCLKRLRKNMKYSEFCSSIPLEQVGFEGFSLDFYENEDKKKMEKILSACKEFSNSLPNSGNLIFSGGTGLGKTYLSLSIVKQAVEKGLSVMYNSAQNFLYSIEKDSFGRSDNNTAENLISCDLCVLDDLGAEFSTQFTSSALYNIINSRITASLPTIISTNLSMDEFEKRYGERIFSRIVGCFKWEQFCGKDIRIQKKLKNLRGRN